MNETGAARSTILIVDDLSTNLEVLNRILSPHYRVRIAIDGHRALRAACQDPKPDLILLDVMMPGLNGYEVCRSLKADEATRDIPVIFVTALADADDEFRGLEAGGVDYLTKPVNGAIVLARVKAQLALYHQHRHLEREVRARTRELEDTRLQIIRRLGRAAEFRDNETGNHVIRMSYLTRFLAESMGLDPAWVHVLFEAAPMHDVGKIGIPDHILLKPGKLDPEEWTLMKRHAEFGAEIIGEHDDPLLSVAREVALTHHERWDGTGYPRGLAGDSIPLSGRIVTIADVFDALTSDRPYKKAWPLMQAVAFIEQGAGTQFDPDLVPLLRPNLDRMQAIREQYGDTPLPKHV